MFQTQYNRHEFKFIREANTMPSLTVPDMNLSLQQLLVNHTRGMKIVSFEPVYNDTLYIPDPKTLDLVDLQNERQNLNIREKEIIDEIKEIKKKRVVNEPLPIAESVISVSDI